MASNFNIYIFMLKLRTHFDYRCARLDRKNSAWLHLTFSLLFTLDSGNWQTTKMFCHWTIFIVSRRIHKNLRHILYNKCIISGRHFCETTSFISSTSNLFSFVSWKLLAGFWPDSRCPCIILYSQPQLHENMIIYLHLLIEETTTSVIH